MSLMTDKIETIELLTYIFNEHMNNSEYDTEGFMIPEIVETSEIIEFIDDTEKEGFIGAPMAIRLSAPGFLDCTDWFPVKTDEDIADFFEMFCTND